MDITEILVLLVFVLLPFLQAVVEQVKRSRRPPPPPPPERDAPVDRHEPTALETMRIPQFPAPGPTQGGGWSGGWGSWPTEAPAPETEGWEAEALDEEEPEELVPEVVRVSTQVVSLEPLHVDRQAEHRRFRDQYVSAPRVAAPRRSPVAARLSRALAGGELRQAMLLSEILAPPLSIRDEQR